MYEVKENSRILKDGTEITTYSRDVVSCNILEVEAVPLAIVVVTPIMVVALISVFRMQPARTWKFIAIPLATAVTVLKSASVVTASWRP